ncbi:MAG: YbfB/YjiJ family MFS transporter [Alphaproteobacteria bacterium]
MRPAPIETARRGRAAGATVAQAHRAAWAGMAAMAAALGIGRFVYTPILPEMMDQLGLSSGAAGLIASANFLGYLVGALAAALPALPGSRRTWLLAALWANAALLAATAASGWLPTLLALRFAGGAASAFVLVYASAAVLEIAAGSRAAVAIHFAGVGTGIVVGAAVVGVVAALGGDWRAAWLAAALPAVAAAVAVPRLLPPEPAAAPGPAPALPRRGATGFGRVVLAYGLFGFGYVITATFLVAMVRSQLQQPLLETLAWVAFGAAAIPSVALWGRVAGRFGVLVATAIACVAEAAGVAIGAVGDGAVALAASALLLGGTFMGITALGLQAARTLAGGDPRRALAAMTAAFGVGQIVGPTAAGMVRDAAGTLAPALYGAAAALVAAALLAWSAGRR